MRKGCAGPATEVFEDGLEEAVMLEGCTGPATVVFGLETTMPFEAVVRKGLSTSG
jgi:hypothetical protein